MSISVYFPNYGGENFVKVVLDLPFDFSPFPNEFDDQSESDSEDELQSNCLIVIFLFNIP